MHLFLSPFSPKVSFLTCLGTGWCTQASPVVKSRLSGHGPQVAESVWWSPVFLAGCACLCVHESGPWSFLFFVHARFLALCSYCVELFMFFYERRFLIYGGHVPHGNMKKSPSVPFLSISHNFKKRALLHCPLLLLSPIHFVQLLKRECGGETPLLVSSWRALLSFVFFSRRQRISFPEPAALARVAICDLTRAPHAVLDYLSMRWLVVFTPSWFWSASLCLCCASPLCPR